MDTPEAPGTGGATLVPRPQHGLVRLWARFYGIVRAMRKKPASMLTSMSSAVSRHPGVSLLALAILEMDTERMTDP